jgi:NitT/TauT family transport system permease protein/taurine transport system permease protein
MVSSLYAVPLVILYPVFTVWLGIGSESKIAFASIYGFLPTMLATAAGIQTIDPQLLLAARSMGATLSQRLVRVIIPAAIPTVLSGLRVGGALVIVGVVVSEMLISSAGIGYLISRYRTILDSQHVFAGVLLVLFLAIAFNAAIRWIERKAAIWQTGTRAGQANDEIAASAMQPAT